MRTLCVATCPAPVEQTPVSSNPGDDDSADASETPSLEASVVIERPVDEVFAFMDDPANEPLWQPGTTSSEYLTEGPVRVGTKGRSVSRQLGQTETNEWTITEYEHNRLVTSEIQFGDFRLRATWQYASVPEGTRVDRTEEPIGDVDNLASVFGRLSQPLILRVRQRDMSNELQNLNRLLEA